MCVKTNIIALKEERSRGQDDRGKPNRRKESLKAVKNVGVCGYKKILGNAFDFSLSRPFAPHIDILALPLSIGHCSRALDFSLCFTPRGNLIPRLKRTKRVMKGHCSWNQVVCFICIPARRGFRNKSNHFASQIPLFILLLPHFRGEVEGKPKLVKEDLPICIWRWHVYKTLKTPTS